MAPGPEEGEAGQAGLDALGVTPWAFKRAPPAQQERHQIPPLHWPLRQQPTWPRASAKAAEGGRGRYRFQGSSVLIILDRRIQY